MKTSLFHLKTTAVLTAATLLIHLAGAAPVNVTWSGNGPDQNWSDAANWTGGTPSGNIVIFPAAMFPASTNVLGATNNVVNQSITVQQLWYINTNNFLGTGSNLYDTTLISPFVTLTVSSNMYVGPNNGVNATCVAAMVGTNCALIVSNPAAAFGIGYTNGANVQFVTFTLADGTNFIDVGTFGVGNSSGGNGRQSILNLGNGTNMLLSSIFELGWGKAQGRIEFAGPSGGVLINGVTPGARANMALGRASSATAGSFGQLMLTNYANVLLSTVTNGWGASGATAGTPSGTIAILDGVFDATTLVMGANTGDTTTSTTTGTFTIGSDLINTATMIINSPSGPGGGMFLISAANNTTHTGAGIFNIETNGTAKIYCSINKITAANNTATINLDGGTLILESVTNVVGSAAAPIDTLNLNGGTLQVSVDGNNTATANITASSVTASTTFGPNIINIGSVSNVLIPVTIHLINYANGGDPGIGNFQLGTYPSGYAATLEDNLNGDNCIDLNIGANIPILPLLWRGAVGSTLNSNWNLTTLNWLNLTNGNPSLYVNPDLTYFDDSASNSTVTLATNFGPAALTFSNSLLNYTLNGTGSISGSVGLIMSGSASVTLAESGGDSFGGGVAVNSGSVLLDNANSTVSGVVSVASGATLQIGNNDNHGNLPSATVTLNGTLILDQTTGGTISGAITGAGALTLNGSGTVTLSSAANNYSGNTMVNAGKLALTGSGTISNSTAVGISSATFDVSAVTGMTLLNNLGLTNAVLNVSPTNAPYLQPQLTVVNGALGMGGAHNTINVASLPAIATYPSALTLIQAPAGVSGFNLALGTLPAGYLGYVTNNTATTVALVLTNGPVGVRPYVTWSGADAQNGGTTNWSDAQNWQLPGVPSPTDTIIFDTLGQQTASAYSSPGGGAAAFSFATVNNIIDTNFTASTLIFTNIGSSGSPSYHNTYINNGVTLTVTNSLAIGSSSVDFGSAAQEGVTMAGPNGTLTVSNASSTFFVGLINIGTSGEQATLDMSGLGTFNAAVSLFEVGAIASTADVLSGVAYLAATNAITATGGNNTANEGGQSETLSLLVGETGKGAGTEAFLYLGQQNVIHAWSIGIGISKDPGEMQFNSVFSNPTATFIGGDGASPVQLWAIGDGLAQTGSSTAPTGTADFTGGTINALVTTMYIGRSPNVSGGHSATGTLTFGAGTIAVGTLYNGFQPFNDTDSGNGTINVNGTATLNVNSLIMALTTGSSGGSTVSALNITGGTVQAGNIAADTNNAGQSTITLNGGTLAVTNNIGSPAAPLTTLNLQGGTLQLIPNSNGTNIVATSISISGPTTINIASVTTSVGGPQQIPIISYLNGTDPGTNNLTLGTIPFGYSGASLVDDGVSTISLSITAPAALVWAGALSSGALDGNWNSVDQNWLNGASFTAYANPDFARFDDTASNSTVTVSSTVSPDTFVVSNNVLNYVFNGSHAITGTGGLTKTGSASLTLQDTGGDSFSGGVTVNGGAVFLDDAGSSIGGNVSIASGSSLQIGNNDSGGNLPGTISDNGSLTLYRSNNVTIAGAVSGSGTMTQIGTNTITLSGANSGFTGKLFITNGILNTTAANGLGGATGSVVVTNGGTLDDNGVAFNNTAAPAITVSGAGYNGAGAIINSGAQQINAFSNVTVAANVTFGGNVRWDIRAPSGSAASLNMSPAGSPYSITKVGSNEVSLVSVGTIDAGLGNILVQQGEFAIQLSTTQLGNPASNLVVSAGAFLEMFGATTPLNKVITFNGNGATDSFKSDSSTASQNVVIGPVALNGTCLFDVSSGAFATFGGVIGGTGGLTKITSGTLTLTNVNTFTGDTVVTNGTLVLSGSGSLASSNIIVQAGAVLNVAGRTNQTLTLSSSQTLSGFGTVTGAVTAASGSTVAPGSGSTLGILTVSGNVALAGTSLMALNQSTATNDVLTAGGALALGGTLSVPNQSGTLTTNDTFKLFSAGGGISGAFSAIVPATPATGLGWNTNTLTSDGVLRIVAAVNPNPTNITASVNGNLLTLSWPSDHSGWWLEVQTNAPGAGLNPNPAAWVVVPGSNGTNSETFTVDPSQGTVFYRMVLQHP